MKFRVIKASIDGVCGGENAMTVKEMLGEVNYSAGWASVAEMHKSIKRWAKQAKPGSIFKTRGSIIVATGTLDSPEEVCECPKCHHEELDYGQLDPVEDGSIEQEVTCPECGERWRDVFIHAERHELVRKV